MIGFVVFSLGVLAYCNVMIDWAGSKNKAVAPVTICLADALPRKGENLPLDGPSMDPDIILRGLHEP